MRFGFQSVYHKSWKSENVVFLPVVQFHLLSVRLPSGFDSEWMGFSKSPHFLGTYITHNSGATLAEGNVASSRNEVCYRSVVTSLLANSTPPYFSFLNKHRTLYNFTQICNRIPQPDLLTDFMNLWVPLEVEGNVGKSNVPLCCTAKVNSLSINIRKKSYDRPLTCHHLLFFSKAGLLPS